MITKFEIYEGIFDESPTPEFLNFCRSIFDFIQRVTGSYNYTIDKGKLVIDGGFIKEKESSSRIYKHIIIGFIDNKYFHVTCSPLREDEYKSIFGFFQHITKSDHYGDPYKNDDYFDISLSKKDNIEPQLTLANYKQYITTNRFDL